MRAMVLDRIGPVGGGSEPLFFRELPDPAPSAGEILVRVNVCGVCHTELDEIEGRTPPPRLPVVLGHQVVGRVESLGPEAAGFGVGERVGVAWIYSACGKCEFCLRGEENLCRAFRATGRDVNGGYAELMTVPAGFAHLIPASLDDATAAPLLCAGAIGYRSVRLSGLSDGRRLGLIGFGASAHLVVQLVRGRYPATEVFVFTRSAAQQAFARELGAAWVGAPGERAPRPLHAIIDTTPAWSPVVEALANLERGGRLVINAIRKVDADKDALLGLSYPEHLWMEKEIKSVANVTRADVREFLQLASEIPIRPEIREYDLPDANGALVDLKEGTVRGAKVLRIQ